jgi:F-type H+-transporting ATPase subunit a
LTDRGSHQFRVRAPVAVWALAAVALAVSGVAFQALVPSAFEVPGRGENLGIALPPDELFSVAGLPVTNTLLSSWLAMAFIIGLFAVARLLARRGRLGMLTALEVPVEAFWDFVVGLVGHKLAPPLFTLAASAVLFILANAWLALLPIYGPVYVLSADGESVPLLRGAGTDVNMSLALALSAGILVQIFGVASHGLEYVERFFRVRLLLKGQLLKGGAELFAGFFELFLELTRVISFTFRLFGSLTAGEVLILAIGFIAPVAVVVPFYGLELLIGAVQAWIFGSLFAVFAAVAIHAERQEPSPAHDQDGAR